MLLERARFIKYKALEQRIVPGRNVNWDLAQRRAQMKESQGDTTELIVKTESENEIKSEE